MNVALSGTFPQRPVGWDRVRPFRKHSAELPKAPTDIAAQIADRENTGDRDAGERTETEETGETGERRDRAILFLME